MRIEPSNAFIDALKRQKIGNLKTEFDNLLNYYNARYHQRLVWPGASAPTRSQTMDDYGYTLATLQNTDVLVDILEEKFFDGVAGQQCNENAIKCYNEVSSYKCML